MLMYHLKIAFHKEIWQNIFNVVYFMFYILKLKKKEKKLAGQKTTDTSVFQILVASLDFLSQTIINS